MSFPQKISADAKRLVISDTKHHRLLVSDHAGRVQLVIGEGKAGHRDGKLTEARFHQPEGVLLDGETIWVADTENHRIRKVDLASKTVSTVAGTGAQHWSVTGGPALETDLNSPWALARDGDRLIIAMAGNHTIWVLDLVEGVVGPWAGDGRERLKDGALAQSSFNQPSGLAIADGKVYVADSEISGVRSIPLDGKGEVSTLVGTGLFDYGDIDGVGDKARLQHVLAVCAHEGALFVADAYNHKIKKLDPKTRRISSWLGDGRAGLVDGKSPRFFEPSGLAVAAGRLFVADQNNHAIRVVDLATDEVSTLKITMPKE